MNCDVPFDEFLQESFETALRCETEAACISALAADSGVVAETATLVLDADAFLLGRG